MKTKFLEYLLIVILPITVGTTHAVQICEPTIPEITPTADFILNDNGTVTHTKTGLMWKRCSEGQTWDAADSTCSGAVSFANWQQALQVPRDLNENGGYAGYNNWRLPNIKELTSIAELRCGGPAINLEVFPATPGNGFWTSTPYVLGGKYSWYVTFNNGAVDISNSFRIHDLAVRIVRTVK